MFRVCPMAYPYLQGTAILNYAHWKASNSRADQRNSVSLPLGSAMGMAGTAARYQEPEFSQVAPTRTRTLLRNCTFGARVLRRSLGVV